MEFEMKDSDVDLLAAELPDPDVEPLDIYFHWIPVMADLVADGERIEPKPALHVTFRKKRVKLHQQVGEVVVWAHGDKYYRDGQRVMPVAISAAM